MHSTTYALDSTWRPLLKDMGLSVTNVLRRAGLPEDLLIRPSARLEAADFHRFWQGIEAEIGDPLLPLNLCREVRSESFSPPLFAALCSPNFLVAARRIARYKALVAPVRLEVREEEERGDGCVCVASLGQQAAHLVGGDGIALHCDLGPHGDA